VNTCKRAVVKLGSSVLTNSDAYGLEIDRNTIYRIASDVADAVAAGTQVIVVSSGAVALGVEELGLSQRPDEIAEVQACASVGQGLLMQLWRSAFGRRSIRVGQILCTHEDLADRFRFLNFRAAIDELLKLGVVPVINENDTLMTDEITVGDNDRLAAQVAKLTGSDRLLLLTTVDGLLDSEGQLVEVVRAGDTAEGHVEAARSAQGRGGMGAKLESARAAAHGGIEVSIINGRRPHVVRDALTGQTIGTRVLAANKHLNSRKHWIAYTLRASGTLTLDQGAVSAVVETGASLLPVGIRAISGDFEAGEAVSLVDHDGVEFARGLARMSSDELRTATLEGPAVHRDDLVVLPEDEVAD
jgi:glutamate 5-kinase